MQGIQEVEIKKGDTYASQMPWKPETESEAIVVHCVSSRFEEHFDDFLRQHLHILHPTKIAIPGGVTLMLPLLGKGFKLGKQMIEFVSNISKAKRIICIAHEDCMVYKEHGKFADWFLSKVVGKSIKELQIEHLRDAGGTFKVWFPSSQVELYYAGVEKSERGEHVVFHHIT